MTRLYQQAALAQKAQDAQALRFWQVVVTLAICGDLQLMPNLSKGMAQRIHIGWLAWCDAREPHLNAVALCFVYSLWRAVARGADRPAAKLSARHEVDGVRVVVHSEVVAALIAAVPNCHHVAALDIAIGVLQLVVYHQAPSHIECRADCEHRQDASLVHIAQVLNLSCYGACSRMAIVS